MESESSISLLTSVRSFVMLFHANVDDQRTFLYLTVAKKSNLLPHKAKNEKKNLTIFKIKRFKSFFGTRLYCSSSPSSCNSSRATQEKTLNKKKATSLIRIASVFFFFVRGLQMFSYYNSLRNYYVRKNSVDFSLGPPNR